MKYTQKHNESRQLLLEGFQHENEMESQNNGEALSVSVTSSKEENNGKEYAGNLLERILSPENMNKAYKRVKKNNGKHGVDGMKVDELLPFLKQNGSQIRQKILEGTYYPLPVRRVEIPKPDGGIRLLGIPAVVDRVIQQAIAQVLTPIYEEEFSEHSYGFRPNRNAHQAIRKCKEYIEAGYDWAVDIDLAKYFDTVNHNKLMRLLSTKIKDGRVLSLIRKYLKSGVMINGVVIETEEGTPQGGNLSPLLSNVMLHELDKELERRGLKFCRYADDCNIYVKSRKAAERVMFKITQFIEQKLRLKVNKEKSAVDRPWKLKFLGFSFFRKKEEIWIRIHEKSVKKFRNKLKEITDRSNAMSISERILRLKQSINGWVHYFKVASMKTMAETLDQLIRRRLRMCYWKQWKRVKTRYNKLKGFGVVQTKAWEYANTRKSYWRISNSPILNMTITNQYLKEKGLESITEKYSDAMREISNSCRTAVCRTARTVV